MKERSEDSVPTSCVRWKRERWCQSTLYDRYVSLTLHNLNPVYIHNVSILYSVQEPYLLHHAPRLIIEYTCQMFEI